MAGHRLPAGRAELTGRPGAVYAVAAAPDGSWLASGGQDGLVRIWDVANGQQRAGLTGHTDAAYAVAAAPDGSWLASGCRDRSVRIWDVASGQTRALMRLDNSVNASAWLNLGTLAIGGPAGLYLFDFLTRVNQAATQRLQDCG